MTQLDHHRRNLVSLLCIDMFLDKQKEHIHGLDSSDRLSTGDNDSHVYLYHRRNEYVPVQRNVLIT